ncbi:MAG: hypothetical protein L7W43_10400 [Rubripirellula sp.]|nr:hypothetical protein [Rubripirellula sp.]
MPKRSIRRFFSGIYTLHGLAVTGCQVTFVLIGVAGNTGFRTDVLDGRVSVEGGRGVQLRGTQNMECNAVQQNLRCYVAVAESGREVVIHWIILMMPAGLFYGRRAVCSQFTVSYQCARNNFHIELWFADA